MGENNRSEKKGGRGNQNGKREQRINGEGGRKREAMSQNKGIRCAFIEA